MGPFENGLIESQARRYYQLWPNWLSISALARARKTKWQQQSAESPTLDV